MSVSGLVVSVADEEAARRVLEQIRRVSSFVLGERVGLRFPVAVDATDARTAERKHEWLRQLPGVVKVDVAVVYLGAEEASDAR